MLKKIRTDSDDSGNGASKNGLVPVSDIKCDSFELGLLPIIRHFLMSLTGQRPDAWFLAYAIAAERLGERIGFPVAHGLAGITERSIELLDTHPPFKDPLSADNRSVATEYEAAFLEMMHHMRRDQTQQARAKAAIVMQNREDPGFIRACLAFARRHRVGDPAQPADVPPGLKIIS